MNNSLDTLVKKIEDSCNDTMLLNDIIKNMSEVIEKYNKTLINLNKNNKLNEIIDFANNLEERMEYEKGCRDKDFLEEFKIYNNQLEDRLKKYIKTQMNNETRSKDNINRESKNLDKNINEIINNQEIILDTIKMIKNDKKIQELENKLKKANLAIIDLKSEIIKRERYYENRINKIEEQLFYLFDSNTLQECFEENDDD